MEGLFSFVSELTKGEFVNVFFVLSYSSTFCNYFYESLWVFGDIESVSWCVRNARKDSEKKPLQKLPQKYKRDIQILQDRSTGLLNRSTGCQINSKPRARFLEWSKYRKTGRLDPLTDRPDVIIIHNPRARIFDNRFFYLTDRPASLTDRPVSRDIDSEF